MKANAIVRGIAALLLLGCSAADQEAATNEPGSAGSPSQPQRCSAASGTSRNPKSIEELLQLINGLPRPVQLPCLLESLERPLALNATSNTQSAQPAQGKRSPRIFIIVNESLSMSLVPGAEATTLEFGERRADEPELSIKGELHFPVTARLVLEDAFVRLAPDESTGMTLDQGTSCGRCHDHEEPASEYPLRGAFASARLKPAAFFAVDVASLQQERVDCDSTTEPERCAVLEALFDHGTVVQAAFP